MVLKFKMGAEGALFPAAPDSKVGERRGTPIWILEVIGAPDGTSFRKTAQLLDRTRIPAGVYRIQFSQLGRDLSDPNSWPDKRRIPKTLKSKILKGK